MAAKALEQEELPSPSFFRFRSSPSFILVTVCIAIFNDVFLFGTIIPILPYVLPRRTNVDEDDVQVWIASLLAMYGGALLVGSLVFGWIGDKLPRRHTLFLFGLCMLLTATVVLAIGRHVAVLIIGRFFQGLSAAIVWTSGLALLTDVFGQERYGESVGYAQISVGVGTTSAPLLGGVVYARGGYSAVSAMSIGTVAISIVLALMMVEPETKAGLEEPTPEIPVATKNNHIVAHEEANRVGVHIQNPTLNKQLSGLPDERSALIQKEQEKVKFSNRPAYPLLLRSGRVLAAMGGVFTYTFVIISFEGMIPLFVKTIFHWDSTHAALIFLSWIIPGFLGPIAGKASDRLGARWIAIGGFLFIVPPLICMRFVTENNTSQKFLLCGLLTLVGLGLVWIPSSCVSDLSAAAIELKRDRPREFGNSGASSQAFGLFVFAYSCGSLVGPIVIGVIREKADWGAATLTLACASAAVCIPIFLKTSASSRRRQVVLQ